MEEIHRDDIENLSKQNLSLGRVAGLAAARSSAMSSTFFTP